MERRRKTLVFVSGVAIGAVGDGAIGGAGSVEGTRGGGGSQAREPVLLVVGCLLAVVGFATVG